MMSDGIPGQRLVRHADRRVLAEATLPGHCFQDRREPCVKAVIRGKAALAFDDGPVFALTCRGTRGWQILRGILQDKYPIVLLATGGGHEFTGSGAGVLAVLSHGSAGSV